VALADAAGSRPLSYVNQAFETFFGYRAAEALGRPATVLLALPVFAALADAERDRVVDGLRAAVGRHGGLTERPGSRANGHAGRTAGAATPEVASQPR
jgi:PAS domain-containing protein